jgi:transcriptional regulator of acetoin/glycerol metabolism
MLLVLGDAEALKLAAMGNAIPGSDWSEQGAGTNSIGTSLYLDKPIQIFGYEHFSICAQGWADSSAPIHDSTGKIIGSVTIGGTLDKVHHHTLGMVVSTAHAIEMQLAMKEALESADLANKYKRTIMDSISEGLIVIDSNNYVTLVNQVSVEMLTRAVV